jgi:hypothetical protein
VLNKPFLDQGVQVVGTIGMTELVVTLELEKAVVDDSEIRGDEGEGELTMYVRVCGDAIVRFCRSKCVLSTLTSFAI